MKNIIIYFLTCLLLTLFCSNAVAQHADSVYPKKNYRDSIFRANHPGHYVPDSLYSKQPVIIKPKKIISYHTKNSLFNSYDSLNKKRIFTTGTYRLSRDTVYKKIPIKTYMAYNLKYDTVSKKRYLLSRLPDSLKSIQGLYRLSYDSLQKLYPAVKFDSSYRYKKIFLTRMDTLKRSRPSKPGYPDALGRLSPMRPYNDSFHSHKSFPSARLDSLRTIRYKKNISYDSVRIKTFLRSKKMLFENDPADTVALKNGYRSRNIAMEITCIQNDTVYINNSYKKIVIKVIPVQKMRLSTSINYKEPLNNRDDELFKIMGIEMSRSANRVIATINTDSNNPDQSDAGKELRSENNKSRTLFIEVPGNIMLYLNSKFARANVENYVKNIHADLNNVDFRMVDAGTVTIKSRSSFVKMEGIKKANLHLLNTTCKMGEIDQLTIVSHNSTLQVRNSTSMQMSSISDQYQIKNAGIITGTKNFGLLSIDHLENQLIFTGVNADVTINKINDNTAVININNKYASMQVPVYKLINYSIYYEGSSKDVNKLASLANSRQENNEPLPKKDMDAAAYTAVAGGFTNINAGKIINSTNINRKVFEAAAGDTTGKYTRIAIECGFCNVLFK